MRIVTLPEDCTRREFLLCTKTALKALTPFGKALVIVDKDDIKYGESDRDGTHCFQYFSDRWPPELIVEGQEADLIAIEDSTHFSKEGIEELLPAFLGKENAILLLRQKRREKK